MTLSVEPGPKYAVEKIAITGNASVPEETLRNLMVTREKGLPIVRKGRLLDADLTEDTSSILGYYQTHGWIEARVDQRVKDGSAPGLLEVEIAVVEGPRAFVTERRVVGADQLDPAEIDKLLIVEVGEPFNPSAVRQDVASLTNWYRNNGWPEASVQDRYTLSEDRTRAEVVYRVEEGLARLLREDHRARQRGHARRAGSCGRWPGRRASPSPRRRSPTRSRTCRARESFGRSRSSPSRPRRARSATSRST